MLFMPDRKARQCGRAIGKILVYWERPMIWKVFEMLGKASRTPAFLCLEDLLEHLEQQRDPMELMMRVAARSSSRVL